MLARSAYERYREANGLEPEIREGLYPGDYLIPVGEALKARYADSLLDKGEQYWLAEVRDFATEMMMQLIREDPATPGVRMDVFAPERQIIIHKGQTVVIHLPEEETTTVQALPPEIATQNILGFFSGLESIGEGYQIQESTDALFLYPREGSGHITVWTNDDHSIARILLKDATGNQSDIRLSNYRFDTGLPEKLFHLEEESTGKQAPVPKKSDPPAE